MANSEETIFGKNPMWPNQQDVVDGVVPTEEVTQDQNLFEGAVDLDVEMED